MSFQSQLIDLLYQHYFNIKVILFILVQSIITLYSKKYNIFSMILLFIYTLFLFYYLLPCPHSLPYGMNFSNGWDNDYMVTFMLVFLYSIYITFIPSNFYSKNSIIRHILYNLTSYSVILFSMYYFNTFSNLNIGCLYN